MSRLGWLARKKYQFEAVTSLTMLEPSEKRVLYVVMFLLLLMTMYTLTVYLPPHLRQLVTFVTGY